MGSRMSGADAARLIAAFFVVMIHAADITMPWGVSFNAAARFGVPVFIILSGYFMLSRERSAAGIARRCARLLALMLCWSALYYVYGLLSGTLAWGGVKELARYLLTQPVHMWYIWTTLFLYALTPPLYVFCAHASRRQYAYALLALFALGSVLELLDGSLMFPTLMLIAENAHLPRITGFIFLYLLGGYLQRYGLSSCTTYAVYALGVLGAAVTVAGTLYLSRGGALNELLYMYTSPNVVFTALAFTLFFLRRTLPSGGALGYAARCTLGVYLLHPLLIMIPQQLGIWNPDTLPMWLAIPIRTTAVYAASLLISLLLGRVPLLKRLVS